MDDATEHLRALLDECGIEHDDNDANTEVTGVRITRWKNGGKRYVRYEEWRNGTTRLDAGNVSPEQAIAATVGNELNPDGLPVGLTISEDGELLNWRGENYAKQSTLGGGECERVKRGTKPNGTIEWIGCVTSLSGIATTSKAMAARSTTAHTSAWRKKSPRRWAWGRATCGSPTRKRMRTAAFGLTTTSVMHAARRSTESCPSMTRRYRQSIARTAEGRWPNERT